MWSGCGHKSNPPFKKSVYAPARVRATAPPVPTLQSVRSSLFRLERYANPSARIAGGLEYLHHLEQLYLSINRMDCKGAIALAEGMS